MAQRLQRPGEGGADRRGEPAEQDHGRGCVQRPAEDRVSAEFTVSKGPFGANNIVCGPAQACLISVTQATPSPTQEADAPISFG
jgi:hypothetical protein